MSYTELQVTTNFSFLRGASHPEEIIDAAIALGYKEIAITDRNTLAGIVRAYAAAKGKPIRLIVGCRLDLLDGPSLLVYPTDKEAYGRLSSLLTVGNMRTEKGQCFLYKSDVYEYAAGMKLVVVPPEQLNKRQELESAFRTAVAAYALRLGSSLYLGAARSYLANDHKMLYRLAQLSEALNVPIVALNDVHYHDPSRRELQDILTCIREKCTIYDAGFRLHQHAERYLKSATEMERLFRQYPDALARTQEIAAACQFSLGSLHYVYPKEITTEGRSPQEELEKLSWEGAYDRYPKGIPEKVARSIEEELAFIGRKNYAPYFLTVYDLVRYARSQNILCQGRGSAANSTVCYCLGITSVNPDKVNLLFARFMSDARDEPPDIDVDFEHERREEVIQYIYGKYGRDRAAIVATVTQLHQRGAIRDVAKAMGMSADAVNRLAGSLWEFTEEWERGDMVTAEGFDARDPHLLKVLELTQQLIGFPRQLGQHTGGFVMTEGRLPELCPVLNARMEGRTCIEWNKDDIEALGFLKVDVLALGMLTCIRKAFDLIQKHYGKQYTLANVPEEQRDVYEMISRGDTIGVFQIESRAQMSMLPRLKPKKFYDLVIEVAIVRPGPIQGDMVHPYLRRRNKEETVDYPKEELRDILGRTLGVPLFQEQAMEIAIVAAGFTPAEADALRRSMATFKAKGEVAQFERKLINGMVANGYEEAFAKRVFRQLEGFGSYGFPESHAASFALLVYVSAYIKCRYPDVFAAALLNSMPMGFYQPAQIIIDAQQHDVTVLPVDINHSCWNNTLEPQLGARCALRLGFRQVKGFNETDVQMLVAARDQHFTHITQLKDAGVSLQALERLADADAFRSIGLDRRRALWEVTALTDRPTGIYAGQASETVFETTAQLPEMTHAAHVLQDYKTMSLSLKAHPVSFVRTELEQLRISPTRSLADCKDGQLVKVAGIVLVRQRPGTASGICFITIEDETGIANLVVFKDLFDRYRRQILQARLLMVTGVVQKEGSVIHVVVQQCHNLNALMHRLNKQEATEIDTTMASAGQLKQAVQGEIFPASRNFR